MKYQENILDCLNDSDKWPQFDRPDFLNTLNEIADNSYHKETVEGYLSALLIYHQLCEEMIKVLIKSSTFYIQLAVFPQYYKEKDLKGKMFGQLINELTYCVIDDSIQKLIQKCRELNKLRIEMVHKITIKDSISDISETSKEAKTIFDEIFILFDSIYDNYHLTFNNYKKNIEEFQEIIR